MAANDLNLSSFVRELILDRIEEDLALDEERIMNARARAGNDASYDHIYI